jgi:hypothetical protein
MSAMDSRSPIVVEDRLRGNDLKISFATEGTEITEKSKKNPITNPSTSSERVTRTKDELHEQNASRPVIG